MSNSPFLSSTTVRSRISTIRKVLERLKRVYDREKRQLEHQIADIQARCDHSQVSTMPQTMTTNLYFCQICGYESLEPIKSDTKRAKEVKKKQAKARIL